MNSAFSLLVCLAGILFQGSPAAPREKSREIVSNERVTIRDVTWTGGKDIRREPLQYDRVVVYLGAGTTTQPGSTPGANAHKPGDVAFERKGTTPGNAGASTEIPVRAILIDLKDHPVPPLANTSGYPEAFPRPGAIKLFKNHRVIAWDCTWLPRRPTPMHFHSKDAIVVYLADGEVKSTTLEGKTTVYPLTFGLSKFGARDRVHREEYVSGKVHAIVVELK